MIRAKYCLFLTLLFFAGLNGQNSPKINIDQPGIGSQSVTIGGSFVLTGTFQAFIGERVDQFVTRIFNLAKAERLASITNPKLKDEVLTDIEKYAKRDIILKHSNGQSQKIDLEKFRVNGDFKNNPYVLHDDYLFFPPLDLIHNFVSIVGAVNKETKFQFVEGDHLSDAVELALGYDPAYEGIKKITISRLSINGETEERLEFTSSEDPLLRRGDRIRVTAGESNRKDFRVYVDGEVRSPGFIPITKSKTTLRDVIILAGGFTDKADLSKAELLRGANVFRSTFFTEEFEELMMNRMADITPEDSTTFFIDNRLRFARGNGTVDFTQLFSDSSDAGNFIVRPDDYISIPEKLDLVYVFGHVNSPGYLSYVPSQGYQYYLQKAGGIGQNPKGEIYLIKGKSRTWFLIDPEHPPKIEAGDYLWVPKQPARTFEYYLSRTTAISGIVSAVATILLLVVQLTK